MTHGVGAHRARGGCAGRWAAADGGVVRPRDCTHHDHSLESETDVRVRRLFATVGDGCVTIAWDYPGKTLLEVRIVRSTGAGATNAETGDAGGAAPGAGADVARSVVVYEGVSGSFRDDGLEDGRTYVYSVSARHQGGDWVHWEDLTLTPGVPAKPPGGDEPARRPGDHPRGESRPGGGAGRVRPVAAALVVLALTSVLAVGALVLGVTPRATAGSDGQGEAGAAAREARAAAWRIALGDPLVVGLLGGREPTPSEQDVVLWPSESAPRGATVHLLLSGGQGKEIAAELPVVRRPDPDKAPTAPYEIVTHRVRATDVTGLRILVDLVGGRVLEVYPWDEHAEFTVREDTTGLFSRLPWFTSRPWALLPVFAGLALLLGIRSYLRSRAWRRRLPSMSRHDRQFLTRFLVAVLMAVAVVLMAAVLWREVAAPIPDPDRLVGGGLSTWPLVLFPPLLYVAALVLELSGALHRMAWGLVAVISGASCVYAVVAMQETAVTDVTLLYYILLGCLALVAIPRAFAPGKLGWSRSSGRAGSSF